MLTLIADIFNLDDRMHRWDAREVSVCFIRSTALRSTSPNHQVLTEPQRGSSSEGCSPGYSLQVHKATKQTLS